MFINCLWFIEQAWETVFKPFTMKICEVISIFTNYLWKTGSWKREFSILIFLSTVEFSITMKSLDDKFTTYLSQTHIALLYKGSLCTCKTVCSQYCPILWLYLFLPVCVRSLYIWILDKQTQNLKYTIMSMSTLCWVFVDCKTCGFIQYLSFWDTV